MELNCLLLLLGAVVNEGDCADDASADGGGGGIGWPGHDAFDAICWDAIFVQIP